MESWRLLPMDAGVDMPARLARGASSLFRKGGRSVRHDGKVAALVALPPLRGATDRELELVARAGDEVDYPAEAMIAMEGLHVDWVHLLIEGSAFAVRPYWRYRPGDWIGAAGHLAGGPALATVMAGTDVRVLTLAVNRFTALMEEVPSLRRAVAVSLARQLAGALKHHASHHPACDGAPPLLRAG